VLLARQQSIHLLLLVLPVLLHLGTQRCRYHSTKSSTGCFCVHIVGIRGVGATFANRFYDIWAMLLLLSSMTQPLGCHAGSSASTRLQTWQLGGSSD
jgi:hypothetical protein